MMILRVLGKSIGPKTVVASTVIQGKDRIYKKINSIAESDSKVIWIPEPSVDSWGADLRSILDRSSVVLGPSIDIFNPDVLTNLRLFRDAKILVPSQWVFQLYSKHLGISESGMCVWAAGIDHEFWNPTRGRTHRYILLYLKTSVSPEEMSAVSEFATNLNLKLKIVEYGKYNKREFKHLLLGAKFLIWAGGTESQGLAQFEAWSMDVPCLVRKSSTFLDTDLGNASPYLSELTGVFTQHTKITPIDLQTLLQESSGFSPRDWIIQNATSEVARRKLLDIARTD